VKVVKCLGIATSCRCMTVKSQISQNRVTCECHVVVVYCNSCGYLIRVRCWNALHNLHDLSICKIRKSHNHENHESRKIAWGGDEVD
jgi:hypothetical protein